MQRSPVKSRNSLIHLADLLFDVQWHDANHTKYPAKKLSTPRTGNATPVYMQPSSPHSPNRSGQLKKIETPDALLDDILYNPTPTLSECAGKTKGEMARHKLLDDLLNVKFQDEEKENVVGVISGSPCELKLERIKHAGMD